MQKLSKWYCDCLEFTKSEIVWLVPKISYSYFNRIHTLSSSLSLWPKHSVLGLSRKNWQKVKLLQTFTLGMVIEPLKNWDARNTSTIGSHKTLFPSLHTSSFIPSCSRKIDENGVLTSATPSHSLVGLDQSKYSQGMKKKG